MKKLLIISLLTAWSLISCRIPYTHEAKPSGFYRPGSPNYTAFDSSMDSIILPYREKLDNTMNEVLAASQTVMEKGLPESKLGNFVADLCFLRANRELALRNFPQADFCLLNNGGLRSSLPAGAITRKNVFELMPFENELVVLTLRGSSVNSLLVFIAKKGGMPVSNLRLSLSGDTYAQAQIGQQDFDPSREYRLVTSDYLADGGDGLNMLKETVKTEQLGVKVRDAIIDHLIEMNRNKQMINPVTDGRISK